MNRTTRLVRRGALLILGVMVVAIGVLLLAGVDLSSPGPASADVADGSISGTVTDAQGNPIEDAWVEASAYDRTGTDVNASTGPDGSYTIAGLATDDYRVNAGADGYGDEYYDGARDIDSATPVAVVEGGDTPNIDFSLDVVGTISGTVTDARGNPIEGAMLDAHPYDDGHLFMSRETWGGAETGPDGSYTMPVAASIRYRVEVLADYYIREYYDGVRELENAAPVSVAEGEDTPNINFSLDVGGFISGTVTDDQGNPLEGVWVQAYPYDDTGMWIGDTFGWAGTGPDGSYTIGGLARDSYKVGALIEGYAFEYYDGAFWEEGATPVAVVERRFTPNINFSLDPGGIISGVVTDSQGDPVAGALVVADPYDHAMPWWWPLVHWAQSTGSDGSYSLNTLGTGSYHVWAVKEGYALEYYDGAFWQEGAAPVGAVVNQETANIDFSLDSGGSISGVLEDSGGNPIAGAQVYANPCGYVPSFWWVVAQYSDSWATAITEADGSYTIPDLGPASYRVRGEAEGYMEGYYDDVWRQADASCVAVVGGQDTPNIGFTLRPPVTIVDIDMWGPTDPAIISIGGRRWYPSHCNADNVPHSGCGVFYGTIGVTILSTPDFDALTEVNSASPTFGAMGDEESLYDCDTRGRDVNGDGIPDLPCRFFVRLLGFQCGDTEGILRGETLDGVPIEGRAAVRIWDRGCR